MGVLEAEAFEAHSGAPPSVDVALEVVAVLHQRGILEQRLEQRDRLRARHLRRREERARGAAVRAMPERHVDGLVRQRDREADA